MSIELVVSWIWLGLVTWLILRAIGQRNSLKRLAPTSGPAVRTAGADTEGEIAEGESVKAPRVAIIVPARDESLNIGPCLRSLLAQRYPAERLRIIVVDDDSSDDTAQVVASMAAADARLQLIATPPLPPGWKGKVHACWVGAAAAAAVDADWLCFIDADMRAHPQLVASAVEAAGADRIDLLSLAPRHELKSFAERLILPCGLYLLGFTQNLERIQAPDSGQAVATGQFMLLAREAYEAVGGFESVREDICEDVALARTLKRRGYRVQLQEGSELLATRMYTGWSTLWPGIAKNLSEMLGGPRRTLVTALVAVALAWASVLIPLFDILACLKGASGAGVLGTLGVAGTAGTVGSTGTALAALVPALAASLAAFGLHLAGAVHFRIPIFYGLLFPLGYTVGAIIAMDSVRWRLARRVHWKGRVYS